MRHSSPSIAGLVLALAFVALPGLALAGPIDLTAHDFSDQTLHAWNTAGYKCQICHTPHGPSTIKKPLWNHKLSAVASYSWSPTTTIGGTTLPTNFNTWDGPSKFCLSCHDGTVGVGDLYTNSYGTACATTECVPSANRVGAGGVMTGNHPVGIPYPFGNVSNTYNNIPVGSGVDLSGASYKPTPAVVRLYNDDGTGKVSAGPVAAKSGIECGSCHDPHNNANGKFLRDAQATICQRCHAF
jgi:predicted CXXCH cytochrome family protein